MRYSSLRNVRVVDLTHHIAGPYATRMLAEVGAEVIKIEPPWGEPARRLGPHRPDTTTKSDRGGLFAFLNINKVGVTLNLKHRRGVELLTRLLDGADLLIENFAPGTLARLGIAADDLLKRFPKLSVISISNFGQDGPDRDAALNDLVLFARGGWTYPVGEPSREPLTPPGSLAQYVGALFGAVAAMQAMLARDLTLGHGQHVDVSILEATVATMIYETVSFQYTGILRERAGKRFAVGPFMIVTLKCRDGYAGLQCVSDKQFESLCDLMGDRELARDPRFNSGLQRMVNNDALLAMLEGFFLLHDRNFLYREGQGRGIPLVPIPSVAELLEWEQLKARNYFETINDPVLGSIRIPGAPLRLSSHQPQASRPAPLLGQHNREIFCDRLGLSERDLGELRSAGTI
jgi:crotonobetainyl-CoA:carnitine CoA-transferase CaiB-like acyl-CoA transferase